MARCLLRERGSLRPYFALPSCPLSISGGLSVRDSPRAISSISKDDFSSRPCHERRGKTASDSGSDANASGACDPYQWDNAMPRC